MCLTHSNPFNEILFLDHEMDPIFEDNLAKILNEPPEEPTQEIEFPVHELERKNILVRMSFAAA